MEWYSINDLLICAFIFVYLNPHEPLQEVMFLISFLIFTELLFQRKYLAVKLHLRKNLGCNHTSLKHCAERA